MADVEAVEKVVDYAVESLSREESQLSTNLKTKRGELQTTIADREKLIADHKAAKAELEKMETQLKQKVLTDKQFEEAGERLLKNDRNKSDLAASKALIAEYTRVTGEKQTAITEAERVRAQSEQAKHWVEMQGKSAEALQKLPRQIHQLALRRLEKDVNRTLEQFESTFRVRTGEDLGYMCHFFDGTVMEDRRISGGQQVVLALAFRWALNSQFANQIGMLVLDEPTAYIDRRHLSLLETTLRRLGAAAKSRGCQVFVITHEASLRGAFDQVVDLERAIA
jgi:DNA repair exonuclease SbcCD ATPase subunit